jgi:hypothetical protein
LSSNDDEYLTSKNVAEMTPRHSVHAACLLTASIFHLISLPESPKNWGQHHPNLNDYLSDRIEISSTLWLPDIIDWWYEQADSHTAYADFLNVAQHIFFIITHVVRVEASVSLGRDHVGWSQSKTTEKALRDNVFDRQYAPGNDSRMAADDSVSDPTKAENDIELKREAEARSLHRMVNFNDFLEMWQGSQNLCATQKESHA